MLLAVVASLAMVVVSVVVEKRPPPRNVIGLHVLAPAVVADVVEVGGRLTMLPLIMLRRGCFG